MPFSFDMPQSLKVGASPRIDCPNRSKRQLTRTMQQNGFVDMCCHPEQVEAYVHTSTVRRERYGTEQVEELEYTVCIVPIANDVASEVEVRKIFGRYMCQESVVLYLFVLNACFIKCCSPITELACEEERRTCQQRLADHAELVGHSIVRRGRTDPLLAVVCPPTPRNAAQERRAEAASDGVDVPPGQSFTARCALLLWLWLEQHCAGARWRVHATTTPHPPSGSKFLLETCRGGMHVRREDVLETCRGGIQVRDVMSTYVTTYVDMPHLYSTRPVNGHTGGVLQAT
eukprot:363431-Chlamydomonas_euryale.AAC.4